MLWRVNPSVAVEEPKKNITGHESEQAYGIRFKGLAFNNFDYSVEGIREGGTDGTNDITGLGHHRRSGLPLLLDVLEAAHFQPV